MRKPGRVILAVFLREVTSYFGTPTGYVFITLFVFLSAMAAFWQERFFAANLANLDQLNRVIPYLLVFLVPAIGMGLWAEEKKQGTDELLLTLPATDLEIVAGKYLAGLAIYSVALVFSLSHVVVLCWLGDPDPGLMAATYLGYWLMGAALLGLAMLASQCTDNLTVAFILGAVFCAAPVFAERAGAILSGAPERLAQRLSVIEQFRDLARGVVTLGSIVYFAGIALAAFYLNVALLGRRRWPGGPRAPRLGWHVALRGLAATVIVGSATLLAAHSRLRLDVTAEKLHSLAPDTRALLTSLSPRQPVFIHAYLSPEVPRAYMDVRTNLVNMLREFDAVGGEAVHVRIVETLKYSPEAREAQQRWGIRPYRVPAGEESARASNEIFLGLAFACGSEEFVIPFFDRGLPVEYELMRSVRVVSRARRKKVGVLDTRARLFGGFDFQNRVQTNEWSIVAELRKQYEVVRVAPESEYPPDLDALVAALPSTLAQAEADRLTAYVRQGRPVLLLVDPMPAFDLNLAPHDIPQTGMLLATPPPASSAPRADLRGLMEALGIAWPTNRIAWDSYNPHPQLKTLPKEFVFVGREGFNPRDPVTAGLQEVVLLYPGLLRPRGGTRFTPLIETTTDSGAVRWEDLVSRTLFGVAINQNLPHLPGGAKQVLAARVRGEGAGGVNAIVVADVDLMGEQFFELRRRGLEQLQFDNVTFLLNAVDDLAGDPAFIALRKRRPRHRTLEAVEARTRIYEAQRLREAQAAEAIAEQRLKEAQARLDRAVREIEQRTDLDEQTRRIMIANVQSVENRRLQVARANIEEEKQRQIENSRAEMENSIRRIQNTIKLLAVALPPVPAFLLFVLISVRKLRRERLGIPTDRLAPSATAGGADA
ncbi:MAG: Gldg family protein [Bryobacterales bacterium]|nr:Gldg family protein [Bryobacteraceae bacterium]MDW8129063.1 Gldg family protein [Bryobacterales bacterium]